MTKEFDITLDWAAIEVANKAAEPFLQAKNEAKAALFAAEEDYDAAWRRAYQDEYSSLEKTP